ncbi:MAG: FliO/MopB family protein [Nitrospinae bacterium]|nr:FliO/MopB family protein [Nitrospinota bacterium]
MMPSETWASQNYLQNLKVYKNPDELRVVMDFLSPIKAEPVPSFYEKSVQFDMPDTYIHPAKRVFEVGDEFLKYVYALQHSKDKVRMRLLVSQSGISLKDRLSVLRDDKNLIIVIKKTAASKGQETAAIKSKIKNIKPVPELFNRGSEINIAGSQKDLEIRSQELGEGDLKLQMQNIASEPDTQQSKADINNPEGTKAVESKIEEVKPQLAIPDSKNQTSNTETKGAGSGYLKYQEPLPVEPPDMSSAIFKTVTALAIVLAAVLLISYIAKKVLKKNDIVFGKDKLIRVLGTSYIGVKKAITLLDVAGEVLVIGVTNNNITMLTKLESEDAKSRIQGVKGSRGQGSDFSSHSNPRTLESSNPAPKEEMVAQIVRTIQEKVRKLKRIQ